MTTSDPGRTPAPRRTLSERNFAIACASGLVAVSLLALAFTRAGQPDTAAGALAGGGTVVVLAVVVRWLARRRGSDGGFSRAVLGTVDERDSAILTEALSWVGYAAFLGNTVGMVAVALGADGQSVLGAIALFLLAVLVGALVVLSHRR